MAELAGTTGDESSPAQISVHTTPDALTLQDPSVTELGSGALLSNDTARRLACDALVETIIHDENVVVGVGRNSRAVPSWLRRQVEHRDGNRCRWVGCGAKHWLQAHHVIHWADGGPTALDNLILLCGHHHRFLHNNQWTITYEQGDFVFHKPD